MWHTLQLWPALLQTNTSLNRSCINKEVFVKIALSCMIYFYLFSRWFHPKQWQKALHHCTSYSCGCIRELRQKIVCSSWGVRCWKFIDPTTKLSELFNQKLRDSWFQTVGLTNVILWYSSLLQMQMLYPFTEVTPNHWQSTLFWLGKEGARDAWDIGREAKEPAAAVESLVLRVVWTQIQTSCDWGWWFADHVCYTVKKTGVMILCFNYGLWLYAYL